MVSFVCDTCNDTLKKPKLDQHAQRCWAVYTCLDCNTTFEGTSYRAHTSCISEDQKYQKSVYKARKNPNKNHPGAPPTPAPSNPPAAATAEPSSTVAPIETPLAESSTTTNGTKRPREDDKDEADKLKKQRKAEKKAAKKASKAAAAASTTAETTSTTPAAKGDATSASAPASEEVSTGGGRANIKTLLSKVVPEVLKESRTLGEVKRIVLEKAAAQGLNNKADVLEAFEKGVSLGGDKPKKMLKLSFE
ncbi:BQ2448_1793 [Microbotryum intermedium]|uniref:BQ2448_1793 protein n=1 Tax=Microbotryum intermedium TaxID=269621 RepID=A0A238FC86_9BASI|nr:BQ2448_1793 [Microbotryum intermedium]